MCLASDSLSLSSTFEQLGHVNERNTVTKKKIKKRRHRYMSSTSLTFLSRWTTQERDIGIVVVFVRPSHAGIDSKLMIV